MMMNVPTSFRMAIAVAMFLLLGNAATAQDRFVSMEVYSSQSGEIGLQHRWLEVLSKCGADRVRSKTARRSLPKPKIEEIGEGRTASIVVTGLLNGRKIHLPGKTFSITQPDQIRAYLNNLRKDGAEVAMAEKLAFGLTSKQLVEVHEELAAKIDLPTKRKTAGEVLARLLGKQKYPVVYDSEARRVLNSTATVSEELKGLSIGTGTAAVLRPLGLVLQPRREIGKELRLHIVAHDAADENWPVGWPNDEAISRSAPKLMERLDLEIRGFTLEQTMGALQSRVGIPFLYDQNGMARRGIEMDQIKVTLVRKQIAHMTAIGKLLAQSKPQLFQELRLDENGTPFLWIGPQNSR